MLIVLLAKSTCWASTNYMPIWCLEHHMCIFSYLLIKLHANRVMVMVFSSIFNNILVILLRSVLLVEETGVPGKNMEQLPHITDKLYHIMLCSPWAGFELTTSVVIGTDCICGCKSNYHTITTTTAPVTCKYNIMSITCVDTSKYICKSYYMLVQLLHHKIITC